ncbi:MAG TPA: uracil-DNA glycosylase, partial [Rhodanobacteraceae bacterium]
ALMCEHGAWRSTSEGVRAFATVHPSYVLRQPDEAARAHAFRILVEDLRLLRGA